MENVLISACLIGVGCRYDGGRVQKIDVSEYLGRISFIPVCPEILGGLPTPRVPSERRGKGVFMKNGRDVTENFLRGAEEAFRLCQLFGCRVAVLKERSPSCSPSGIYDGSFTGRLIDGEGVTAEYLRARGITVIGESEFFDFFSKV